MKKLLSTFAISLLTTLLIAQAPQAFKYQAVVRNATGEIISGQLVSIRLTILEGYPGGSTVYSEIHQPVTNQFGLVSLELGHGIPPIIGNFELISWSFGNHFLQVELDENGSSSYQLMGVSPLLSVPYSQWADSAGNVIYSDTSAFNELQHLALIDHELFITDGNSVILPDEVEDADPDPMNEFQILEIIADTLFITNGNYVVLPPGESLWFKNGNSIFFNTGKVGIGTEDPITGLHVNGNINIDSNFMMNGERMMTVTHIDNTFVGINAGTLDSPGNYNTALGSIALSSLATGEDNTAIGAAALRDNLTGSYNTAVGKFSLSSNTIGINNTANGNEVLLSNTSGSYNTGIGASTLYHNTTGNYNTALGANALWSDTTGSWNTATGYQSLAYNTTGIENTANGANALFSNTTGDGNIAMGSAALASNITGYSNIGIGLYSLYSITTNSNLVAIGDSALYNNGIGASGPFEASKNTAIGSKTLFSNTTGYSNTATGFWALNSNTSGIENTAYGDNSLYANTTGNFNAALGSSSLASNLTGVGNTATGYSSLHNNTTGNFNTAHGNGALYGNTTGSNNTANGIISLFLNTTGDNNTAFGYDALSHNTTGYSNVAIGVSSLKENVSKSNLVAIGDSALFNNNLGALTIFEAIENTAVGSKSLFSNSTGSTNTAIGFEAGHGNTTGDNNTAMGGYALFNLTSGSNNTVIGTSGYPTGNTTYSNYTGIGYYVGTSVADPSNRVEIGNTSVGWIGGQVSWSTYSDERIKDNIKEDVPGLAFINKLRPVSYKLNVHRENEILYGDKAEVMMDWPGKYELENIRITGFLAQEVEQASKDCNYDFSGVRSPKGENDLYSVSYSQFVVPLVKAVQELAKENEALKVRIEKLEKNQ